MFSTGENRGACEMLGFQTKANCRLQQSLFFFKYGGCHFLNYQSMFRNEERLILLIFKGANLLKKQHTSLFVNGWTW